MPHDAARIFDKLLSESLGTPLLDYIRAIYVRIVAQERVCFAIQYYLATIEVGARSYKGMYFAIYYKE